ncbi:MAG: spermidine synthase, partial [Saprospiraceae bacterium]
GEWCGVLALQNEINREQNKSQLQQNNLENLPTQRLKQAAIPLITSFGKDYFNNEKSDSISINRVHQPVIHRYYLDGKWDVY